MITIMTPTYNRAYILENAYRSLKSQTSFAFEWIVIDDGSSDSTEQMVAQWIKECVEFPIIYFKQPNGGKHRAVNRAVRMAHYDWFLILDSDDQLTKNAVETIHTWIAAVADLNIIVGVAGLKGSEGRAIGDIPKQAYIDATNLERKKYGLLGDKAEVYKTTIMKQYPFPEFDGENFIRESSVWDHIAKDGLKVRWYNKIIYLCEYIEDGLTKNTGTDTYKRNFQGFTYCTQLFLETHTGLPFLLKCGEFYRIAKLKHISLPKAAEMLEKNILLFCAGILLFQIKEWVKTTIGRIQILL